MTKDLGHVVKLPHLGDDMDAELKANLNLLLKAITEICDRDGIGDPRLREEQVPLFIWAQRSLHRFLELNK